MAHFNFFGKFVTATSTLTYLLAYLLLT